MKVSRICRFCLVIFFSFSLLTQSLFAIANWTVLVYVQAKNNLNKFAAKNLSDMASVGSNENLNILVQWYQPNQKGIWRYKIEKNKINLDTCLASYETDGTCAQDLIDSMKWAVEKYPAQKYFLILWNHGIGILDPTWSHPLMSSKQSLNANPIIFDQMIEPKILQDDPRIQITELIKESEFQNLNNQTDSTETEFANRGILFNEFSRTYLNNQDLAQALKQICENILHHKKLDILGMDACLMAMLEVGYQVKNYANYLVASQEVEMAHGWDYLNLLKFLSNNNFNPVELAESVVQTYELFYKNKVDFYTQSAVDLQALENVKDSVDYIVDCIKKFKNLDEKGIRDLIKQARKDSLQFSSKNYVDLYSFLSQLCNKLDKKYLTKKSNLTNSNSNLVTVTKDLKEALMLGMNLIESSVLASVAGNQFAKAKGLSIYFPYGKVDSSYAKTEFAKQSSWLDFLNNFGN